MNAYDHSDSVMIPSPSIVIGARLFSMFRGR
jgi:hypothetical protein